MIGLGTFAFMGFLVAVTLQAIVLSFDERLVRIGWWWRVGKRLPGLTPASRRALLEQELLQASKHLLPRFMYFLGGLGWAAGMIWEGFSWNGMGMLASYVGTLGLGEAFLIPKYATDRKLVHKRLAAREIARFLDADSAIALMVQASRDSDDFTRLVAVESFEELMNSDSFAELARLEQDGFPAVSWKAMFLLEKFGPVMEGKPPRSVLELTPLLRLPNLASYGLIDALRARTTNLDYNQAHQILLSQFLQLQAYPHVYCRACRARAERFVLRDGAWLRCIVCKDATALVSPVERVVGQIGGVEDWHLEGGVLRVNLWDAAHQTALPAQLDELEIIGGQAIDYNWAVVAVLDELRNPHLPDVPKPKITLQGKPPLDLNTLRLLKAI